MEHLHQHWDSMHWFEREDSRVKATIKTIPFLSDGLPCVDLNKEHYLLEREHGLSAKNLHILAESYASLGNFIAAIECYKLASKISTPALPCEVSTPAKPLTVEPVEVVAVDALPLRVLTLNWDNCTIGMRELICEYGAINKIVASKKWCDIDEWLKLLLIDAANKTGSVEKFNLTGNTEQKKTTNRRVFYVTPPKPKPRGANLTKMARAGIMVLGWFFARELFNAAGQGKIREFLSQGLKMAWNFDALTVADFARFFAQCTDDTKAAKVYALYCQVMPCPLSLEDLMRLSARLNLNPITAQYRRLSIEETRHAMH